MAELLCAIEEGRDPINNARGNLRGLSLCFEAIASAMDGVVKEQGGARKLRV